MAYYRLPALWVLAPALSIGLQVSNVEAQGRPARHAVRAVATSPATAMFALTPERVLQQAPVDTTITIHTTGSDLEFVPATIALKQGTRARIRYVNRGTFPHNIVIVKTEDDIEILGVAAFQAAGTGYVPLAEKERMVAYSALAEPGRTIELVFVVPPAGEYPFVCLYPGHYNMMVGTLRSLR